MIDFNIKLVFLNVRGYLYTSFWDHLYSLLMYSLPLF